MILQTTTPMRLARGGAGGAVSQRAARGLSAMANCRASSPSVASTLSSVNPDDASGSAAVPLHHQISRTRRSFTTSLNTSTPYNICFLRHGQSTWNRDNVFIGWTDTPLTDDGVLEARVAGQILARSDMKFDEVHTSLLRRSIRTANMALMELGQEYLPVYKSYRLNERNYGALVGRNKKEVVRKFGEDRVRRWRRSYDEPPPPMDETHEYWPGRDPRYRDMVHNIPKSESLKDTMLRSSVYWDEVLAPALRHGKTLLVVGHENNLRSLIMRLEDIPREDIIHLSLPRAVPLAYRLDANLKPLARPDGRFDEATGFLRGVWLGGDDTVSKILARDEKQVYDTTIDANLEVGSSWQSWRSWMEFAIGRPSPEMRAASVDAKDRLPNGLSSSSFSSSLNGEAGRRTRRAA